MNKKEGKTDWVFVAAAIASVISVGGLIIVFVLGEIHKFETTGQVGEIEDVEECPVCIECPLYDAMLDNIDTLCKAWEQGKK